MPTTTLAPPKSFRGLSPRELMSAEAGDGGPPVTVFGQTTRLLTLHAGPELVITEPAVGPVRVDEANTDVITINIAGYKKFRFQCPVQVSSVPEGTRLAFRGLRFLNGEWEYLTAATEAPYLPLHEVITNGDGAILPVISDWFVIDAAMDIDSLTLEWVVYGGDGTGEVIIGNIYVELSADPRPPTTTIPDPETPTGELWVDWNPTEGAGEWVENKLDGGVTPRRLILGDSIANSDRDPTWGVDRLVSTALFGADHQYLHYTPAPDFTNGASFFFYGLVDQLGTATKYLCGVYDGVVIDHHIYISNADRLPRARITEDSGGAGGTDRTVVGTTAIVDDSEHTFCFTHDGSTLKIYIDGALEGSTACGLAKETGGRIITFCTGSPPLTTVRNGPDNYDHGRTLVATRALTAAEVAETHAAFKVQYPGLP